MLISKFRMDVTGDQTLPGYTYSTDWNGWARPYFTFDVAQEIVESFRPFQTAYYDAQADEFVFEDDGEEERFGAVEFKGQKLYPVGAGVWIWEEVE